MTASTRRNLLLSVLAAVGLMGTMVLVPWANQFLSALDAQSGEEFARIRVHDGVGFDSGV